MRTYLWGGVIIILGVVFMTLLNYRQYQVERNGIIVKMKISEMPDNCIGTKVKHNASFVHENRVYVKQVGGSFCDTHSVGESMDMKYLDGVSFIMFPSETVVPVFYMLSAGLILGLGSVGYYFVKRNHRA